MQSNHSQSQLNPSWADMETAWQHILDIIPTAAYACDAKGLITYFNPIAEALWGRAPKLRDTVDRYCGSYRLYLSDGTPIRHEECWMARALKEGRAYTAREIVVERLDGTRVFGEAYAHPLRNGQDQIVGAVNLVADITAQRDRDQGAPYLAPIPKDATLAIIEVATSVLTGIRWNTSVFN